MEAVPGLPGAADHVPTVETLTIAAMVADPPGKTAQLTVWSVPAFGFPFTITAAVSVHAPLVQMKLYVPGALKPLIVVAESVGLVMTAVPGLFDWAVHVPVPVAAIVAAAFWQVVWSGPALVPVVMMT